MAEGSEPAVDASRKWARTRGTVRYSPKVAAAICARVAAGELLYQVLREKGMPTPQSVGRWRKERTDFGAALAAARTACGRTRQGGGVWTYCEGTAQEVFERLCDGESLTAIGADPTMPCLSTLFYWRNRIAGFEDLVQLGMRVRAERFCDDGWAMAEAATTETAYLTQVRLAHLRWMAGVMAPRTFRPKLVDPPEGPKPQLRWLMRRFEVEDDPETGKQKVVSYCPNPDTGEVEREDMPGWRQAPDSVALPGGRRGAGDLR